MRNTRNGLPRKAIGGINLVNMDPKLFDASSWPLADCGLLGPVTLQPLRPAN